MGSQKPWLSFAVPAGWADVSVRHRAQGAFEEVFLDRALLFRRKTRLHKRDVPLVADRADCHLIFRTGQ